MCINYYFISRVHPRVSTRVLASALRRPHLQFEVVFGLSRFGVNDVEGSDLGQLHFVVASLHHAVLVDDVVDAKRLVGLTPEGRSVNTTGKTKKQGY